MNEPIDKLQAMVNCNYLPQTMLYELSLADHAELWASNKIIVPERGTPEWDAMYQAWILFAFADFRELLWTEEV